MIVYSDDKHTCDPDLLIEAIENAGALEALIKLGQLESGVADAGAPDNTCSLIRALIIDVASWWLGHRPRPDVGTLRGMSLPSSIVYSTPEGFAWYALYPEQYAMAASRFVRENRPLRCHVIGIRSIGTTLSGVVCAQLRHMGVSVESITARPTGHPFERKWTPAESIQNDDSTWLIVDEGPGISGSTFGSIADALSARGIPDESIVFFPAWDPSPSQLASPGARIRWQRHRRYVTSFDDLGIVPSGAVDLSAGMWRDYLRFEVPVQPQHERRKYLADGVLWKFVGLGHLAEQHLEKAKRLAAAGWGPQVLGVEKGFVQMRWFEGRPERAPIETMSSYVDFTSRETTRELFDPAQLIQMMQTNLDDAGLSVEIPAAPDRASVVRSDGRMFPHKWIRTQEGFHKVDGHDHFRDHFVPGCQPIEWDIAGAMVECNLEAPPRSCEHLDFWLLAYSAYRLGYATMAGGELEKLVPFYRRWTRAAVRVTSNV
ncbi:MAG TPA: hypothetical protein VE621_05635 [Bryobacteraceae bacterium]|nr:hypothetical protein [Bryobacteraceae bacterium]